MKKRILFVDDEPKILEGLQRTLRSMRQEWEMQFAGSGQEALECLSKEPFDVVVSDIRMPGMDGAQLLKEVMRLYPQIARIILSGHSDQEIVLKSVRIAHQYLSKPCEADTLKSVVTRTCALRELLADDALRCMVSNMDSIPSLPSLYVEIMEEIQSPNASIQRVGKIISKDMGMTTKILQLVNSAFFGLRRHVSSPSQAATLLGLDTIRALVLSVHIFTHFDSRKPSALSLERVWKHSFLTAGFAKAIAEEERQKQVLIDDSFMAGLLHDLGKLILSINFPEQYGEAQAAAKDRNIFLWEAEREIFSTSHSEVGAYLIGLWGLPDPIIEGLAFHHDPNKCQGQGFSPLLAVHVANVLEHQENTSEAEAIIPQIAPDYLAKFDMANRLTVWKEICRPIIQEGKTDE
jgi:HD-like signal output (HDOD) protein/CheY-like chemotaxis protein